MFWKEDDGLSIIPAGGVEDGVGHTCFLYVTGTSAVVVDCGIKPQLSWAPENPPPRLDILDDVLARGLKTIGVITHAHLDHIGSVKELIDREIPVYLSQWSSRFMERYADNLRIPTNVETRIFCGNQTIAHGDLEISFIPVHHSIPGTHAILIRHGKKNILHLGDFKFNGTQESVAETRKIFQDIRNRVGQIDCLVLDILNAEMDGFTPPEQQVFNSLKNIIAETKNQVIITFFASNIRRMEAILGIAKSSHRAAGVVGWGMASSYKLLGKSSPSQNGNILLIGGSQGEENSALARLARKEHRFLNLSRESTVVFSTRCIPGNEERLRDCLENLHANNARIILHEGESKKLGLSFKPEERFLHVSGHEQRGGLQEIKEILKPEMIIPFHAPEDRYAIFERLVGGKQTRRLQTGETLKI